jgi:hypothetical protein
MRQRPTLRVVIASATMDVQKFAMFFANAQQHRLPPSAQLASAEAGRGAGASGVPSGMPAVLSVEGRLYPVQEHFLTVRPAFLLHKCSELCYGFVRAQVCYPHKGHTCIRTYIHTSRSAATTHAVYSRSSPTLRSSAFQLPCLVHSLVTWWGQ